MSSSEHGVAAFGSTYNATRNVGRPDIQDMAAGPADDGGSHEPEQASEGVTPPAPPQPNRTSFHDLYRAHFDFVFRNLRRLGVPSANIDDAVQEVFLVVLRQLDQYRPETHERAWLFAIALRVARNHLRSGRRRDKYVAAAAVEPNPSAAEARDPFERAAAAEAIALLRAFLAELDEDRRSVFIMTELEQMSAPEIAAALGVNVNTVYARIRAARQEFVRTVEATHKAEADHGSR